MSVALKAERLQHGLEGSKKQKTTPRYIGHRGVLTPWYLGHQGVLTPRYLGPRGVSTLRCIGHRGVILKCL